MAWKCDQNVQRDLHKATFSGFRVLIKILFYPMFGSLMGNPSCFFTEGHFAKLALKRSHSQMNGIKMSLELPTLVKLSLAALTFESLDFSVHASNVSSHIPFCSVAFTTIFTVMVRGKGFWNKVRSGWDICSLAAVVVVTMVTIAL